MQAEAAVVTADLHRFNDAWKRAGGGGDYPIGYTTLTRPRSSRSLPGWNPKTVCSLRSVAAAVGSSFARAERSGSRRGARGNVSSSMARRIAA